MASGSDDGEPDEISIDLAPLKEQVERMEKRLTLSAIELAKLDSAARELERGDRKSEPAD